MATYKYYIKTGVNGETQEVNFNAVDSSTIEGKSLEQIKTELSTLETPISIKGVDENGSPTVIECDNVEEAIAQLNEADNVITVTLDNTINTKEQALNTKINNTNKSLDDTNKNLNNTTNLLNKLVDFIGYVENSGIEFRDVIADFTDGKLDNEDFHALIENYYNDKLAPSFDSINSDLMGHLSKEAFEEFLTGIFTDVKTETEDNSKGIGQLELDITDLKNTDINNIKVDINNITDNLKDKITLSDAQSASQSLIEQEFDKFNTERFNPTIKDISDLIDTKPDSDTVDTMIGTAIGSSIGVGGTITGAIIGAIQDWDTNTNQPGIENTVSGAISGAVSSIVENYVTPLQEEVETKTTLDEAKKEISLHLADFKTNNIDNLSVELATKVTQTDINNTLGNFKTGEFKNLSDLVDTKLNSDEVDSKISDFDKTKLQPVTEILNSKLDSDAVDLKISNFETNKINPINTLLNSKLDEAGVSSVFDNKIGSFKETDMQPAINDAVNAFKTGDFANLSAIVDTKVTSGDIDDKITSFKNGDLNTIFTDKLSGINSDLANKLTQSDVTNILSDFDTSKIKPITEILEGKLDTDGVNSLINNFETNKIKPITDELATKLGETDVNGLIDTKITAFDTNTISAIRTDLSSKINRTDTESLISTAVGDKVTSTQLSNALKDKLDSTQVGSAIDNKLSTFKTTEVTPIMTIIGSSTDGVDKDTLFGKIAKNDNSLNNFIDGDFTTLSNAVGNKLDSSTFNTFKTTGEFKALSDSVALKASSNDLSSLNNTVTNLSTTVANKANINDVYTSTKVNELLDAKANSSTVSTLSTNLTNLTDNVYTKTEIDNSVSSLTGKINDKLSTSDFNTFKNTGDFKSLSDTVATKADSSSVYTKTDMDGKISTINTNIGTKANVSDVYSKTDADSLLAGKASTSTVTTISNRVTTVNDKLTNILDSSDNTKVKYSSIPTSIQDVIEELNIGNSDALDELVHEGIYLIKYRTGDSESLLKAKTHYAILVVERDSRIMPMAMGASTNYTVTQTLYGENIKKRSGTIKCTCTSMVQTLDGVKKTYSYSTFEGVSWTTINLTNSSSEACIEKGTLITMADGSQKAIEYVNDGDLIMGWDFENNCTHPAVVMYAGDTQTDEKTHYIVCDDTTVLSLTDRHSIYCKEFDRYVPINDLEEGNHLLNVKGEEVEIAAMHFNTYKFGTRQFYHIISSNNTYFANGILNAIHPADKYNYIVNRLGKSLTSEIVDIIREDSKEFECFDFTATNKDFLKEALQYQKQIKKTMNELDQHRYYLMNTDYIALKYSEGQDVDTSVIEKRQNARNEINRLQLIINENQLEYNKLLEKYSDIGSDILLPDNERRVKYFKLACKHDNEKLEVFKKYFTNQN